jgi:hypothetical protein
MYSALDMVVVVECEEDAPAVLREKEEEEAGPC